MCSRGQSHLSEFPSVRGRNTTETLQILANPLQESASNRDGIIYVVSRMKWYWELVDLLLDGSSQSPSKTAGLRHVLKDNIIVLYQQLLFYQMKSICRYYRNRFVVFFKDVVKLDDWAGKLDDIKKAEAALQMDSRTLMTQDMGAHVQKISQGLETLASQLAFSFSRIEENQDNKDCLRALYKTDPDYDMQRIMADKGGLLHDSYRWILNHSDFVRWQTDPRVRRLLITGDAGKGKTMLLCGIIEALKKDDFNRLCYFFCQATLPSLNNSVAVLRGLIYHLVSRYPRLLVHVRKEYDGAGQHIFEDQNAWQVLSKVLDTMLKDSCLDGVFVIVDALDECIVDRAKLLAFINATSHESRSRAKWIVSSRNWPEITNSLDGSQPDVNLSLKLTDVHISGAVEQYITQKVVDLTKTKKYMSDPNTHDQVERHLRDNSGNTFLWVALVWKELNAGIVIESHHAKKVLEKSPPGLDELYERIIGHVCDQSGNMDAEPCKQVLAIASVAQRLLTLQELVPLIQLDFFSDDLSEKVKQLRTLVGYCGSFLHLRDDKVYFVHQSAKDFLLLQKEGKRSFDLIFPSGVASQHHGIFLSSLKALTETLRRDIYGLRDPGVLRKEILPPSQDPLAPLSYCCRYWVKHLTESIDEGHAAPALRDLQDSGIVHEFLKKKFLYWLEALSLSGNISQAVEPIRVLTSIIVRRVEPFFYCIN